MNYSAAIAYLYSLQKHGIKLGLETMATLMARLDSPHGQFRTLHIAGTNGKGSTAAMTAAVLQAAGFRVGLYTSPHLVDFRERIRVDGKMIDEEHVSQLTQQIRDACGHDLSPTFFESTTAMAFQYFADASVDVAVVEVGLGGRFDATNVVQPVACAITTIALDHQEYLGPTLSSIAAEKAGIIKPRIPVIVGRLDAEAEETIERIALEQQAPMYQLNREFQTIGASTSGFDYRGVSGRRDGLACPLAGRHQLDNAACALALLEAAAAEGLLVPEEVVREGLRSVKWEGRLEIVERSPTIVLDGAHNPAAASVLADSLAEMMRERPRGRLILVFGMMRDKNHRGFIMPLRQLVGEVVLTQADLPRSATVSELRVSLRDLVPFLHEAPVPVDALALAKQLAGPDDVICVTGSLMLVGDVTAIYRGCGLSPIRG
ncbi:MAG TPA: folylpolyglutamate synthase/dihydrofolate synthase family protein [Nitrospiraceae bacterium]